MRTSTPLLFLALLVPAFWFGAFVSNFDPLPTTGYSRDFYGYFFPRFVYGPATLAQGRLPLWDPYEHCGVPFLAGGQSGVFNPITTLVFWLFSPDLAPHAYFLVHFFLTAALTYGFARAAGLGTLGASVAAIAWTFSPALTRSLYNPNRIACLMWLPAIFWLGIRLRQAPTLRRTAALALALAAQCCAGYPEFALDTGILLGLWTLLDAGATRKPPQPPLWRCVALLVLAAALAVGLASVQLLPTVELIGESARSEIVARPLLPGLRALVTFFGLNPDAGLALLAMLPAFYVGAVPLVLAVHGLTARPARVTLQAGALSIACVLAVVGYGYLRMLPVYSGTRFALSWALLLPFFTAVLAGIGGDALATGTPPTRRTTRIPLLALALVLALFAVLGTRLSAVFAAAAAALVAAGLYDPRRGRLLASAALVLVVGDLSAHLPYWKGTDPLPPLQPSGATRSLVSRLKTHDQPVRFLGTVESFSGVPLIEGVQSIAGVEGSLTPRHAYRLVRHFGLHIGPMKIPLRLDNVVRSKPLLDLMGLTYVTGPERWSEALTGAGFEPLRDVPGDGRGIWTNPTALPRAFLVRRVRVIPDDGAAFRAITEPAFRPDVEAIVPGPLARPLREAASGADGARVTRYEPELVSIETRSVGPALLVLADTHYPGWHATVDGAPARIHRADLAFRGVEVPGGRHTVRFTYRPRSFLAGAAISLATLAILAGAVLLQALPGRR